MGATGGGGGRGGERGCGCKGSHEAAVVKVRCPHSFAPELLCLSLALEGDGLFGH